MLEFGFVIQKQLSRHLASWSEGTMSPCRTSKRHSAAAVIFKKVTKVARSVEVLASGINLALFADKERAMQTKAAANYEKLTESGF